MNNNEKKFLHFNATASNADELHDFCHDSATRLLRELGVEPTIRLAHAVLFAYTTHSTLCSIPGAEPNEQCRHNMQLLHEILECAGIDLDATYSVSKHTTQD